jgi:hypothetical protein
MKHTFELEWEQVDAIIVKELSESLNYFNPENRPSCGMFYNDEQADLREMEKMHDAFKLVLSWYAGHNK